MDVHKVGKAISQAFRQQARFINQNLGHLGLSIRTLPFLMDIAENEGTSQKDLANRMFTDKTRTVKAVKSLTSLGFIDCIPDKKDKRIRVLKISVQGRKKLTEIKKILTHMNQLIMEDSSEEEIKKFVEMLNKIKNKLHESQ